jgi:23S rRNA pseudouridine955/2504/2580 synthase
VFINPLIYEKINADFAQSRLDVWARHKWSYIPYSSIQKAIRKGLIKVDGKKAKALSRLHWGSIVSFKENWPVFFYTPQKDREIAPEWVKKLESWIVYEDQHILVLNKPNGIACQGGSGQRYHVDGLMQAWRQTDKIRLVHRLDKQTSGLLILAKKLNDARELSSIFHHRGMKKVYWACVQGRVPLKGLIDTAMERKGRIMVPSHGDSAQKCLTRYTRKAVTENRSWVEIYPLTGRMHQIRAHMASIGHPVHGDSMYGPQHHNCQNSPLFLHCRKMSWTMHGRKYSFVAPFPNHFKTCCGYREAFNEIVLE